MCRSRPEASSLLRLYAQLNEVIRRVESHTPGRPPGPRRRGATVQIGYVNRNQQKDGLGDRSARD